MFLAVLSAAFGADSAQGQPGRPMHVAGATTVAASTVAFIGGGVLGARAYSTSCGSAENCNGLGLIAIGLGAGTGLVLGTQVGGFLSYTGARRAGLEPRLPGLWLSLAGTSVLAAAGVLESVRPAWGPDDLFPPALLGGALLFAGPWVQVLHDTGRFRDWSLVVVPQPVGGSMGLGVTLNR